MPKGPIPHPHSGPLMQEALSYAGYGWRVFPVHYIQSNGSCSCGQAECGSIGNHPRTKHGIKDATTDEARIRRWWQVEPKANIGIATGNGLLVITLDPRKGGDEASLESITLIPGTTTVMTDDGGLHFYFAYDPSLQLGNTTGKLGPGIDTHGENGYVLAPPSTSTSDRKYMWMITAEMLAPQPLPQKLIELLQPSKVPVFLSGKTLVIDPGPEPLWIIPGLLPEGITLLVGKHEMGKSWFALYLALAITENMLALGQLAARHGTVLYLGLEDNRRRMADRLKKLMPECELSESFKWVGAWNPMHVTGLADLEEALQEHPDTRLVVIDTLARVYPPCTDGSVSVDDSTMMMPLNLLARKHHIAILIIHHLRKSDATDSLDEVSGTNGLTEATDCNMVLRRKRGKEFASLYIAGRDVTDQKLHLHFDKDTARWSIAGKANISAER